MRQNKENVEDMVTIDAHSDILYDVLRQRQKGRKRVIQTDYLPNMIKGNVKVVVASLYIDEIFLPEMALRRAMDQISALYAEIDESYDQIALCKSYEDIIMAKEQNKLAILLSFEGVEPLYNDLSLLRIFYELGVRGVGLTWSRRNFAADGCSYKEKLQGIEGGITEFGACLIEEAQRLGMFIDVSHLNDKGFLDVIKMAKNPIIASHSNCRALVDMKRNLSDEQIRAIASTGGVIGINASNILVASEDPYANIEGLVKHINHIVSLVGVKHVGLGLDLCDKLLKYLSSEVLENIGRKPFDTIKGHQYIKQLIQILIEQGYKVEAIKGILGGNFLSVYEKVLRSI